MSGLLFLAHRVPYPPNKGDKLRSFHILKYLANKYDVCLGAFIDYPEDWRYVDTLKEICRDTCFVALDPRRAKWRSLRGFATSVALTLPYYHNAKLQTWVDSIVGGYGVKYIVVFSSAMAQYVIRFLPGGVRSVIDFVDVDSDKWRQYANSKHWPMSWLYRREYARLLTYERHVASKFDTSVFVSEAEAMLFKTLAPEVADRVIHINNGVDTDYFSCAQEYSNPYDPGEKVLVFTGAMDYWANVDAVCWFASEVFPTVRIHIPEARFYVVGTRPVAAVRKLAREPGVRVTGNVQDVRPYLAHAKAAVAPLRLARGVQNKVLEAMAMGKPVLATTAAMDGIKICDGSERYITDHSSNMTELAIELLTEGDVFSAGLHGRECVLANYKWEDSLACLDAVLDSGKGISAVT
jgi:sugar transferase (PEP-CTERM/EpsH1 system associated)